MLKRLIVALLILCLLPNPLWAANYVSSVRVLMRNGEPWCSVTAIEDPQGYLSAAHCFRIYQGEEEKDIHLTVDGHAITLLGLDLPNDIAFLVTPGYFVPPLSFAARDVKVGDAILVTGYPAVSGNAYAQFLATVLATGQNLGLALGKDSWHNVTIYLFTDNPGLTNGMSGGAVIRNGKLVGIHVARHSEGGWAAAANLETIREFVGR